MLLGKFFLSNEDQKEKGEILYSKLQLFKVSDVDTQSQQRHEGEKNLSFLKQNIDLFPACLDDG